MPNPHPTQLTTGYFSTREELVAEIKYLRLVLERNWTQIGDQVGVSARTAKRCFEETKAAIAEVEHEASTLPTATKIAFGLLAALLIVALFISLA